MTATTLPQNPPNHHPKLVQHNEDNASLNLPCAWTLRPTRFPQPPKRHTRHVKPPPIIHTPHLDVTHTTEPWERIGHQNILQGGRQNSWKSRKGRKIKKNFKQNTNRNIQTSSTTRKMTKRPNHPNQNWPKNAPLHNYTGQKLPLQTLLPNTGQHHLVVQNLITQKV